ncbi:MAG TPA: ankyrin repeat domain-containing protein [Verrucomicrobiota bacterium]|nr:ankyrin repeat domain-containing protein [Verrucomicrobiota bacterium]HQB16036.1 ankyrin repeat domain-containing protein [Verrucomicrobiota bacterium]
MGEIYRKQSKTNEAIVQYERIVREFPDQETLVRLSRQNLAGIGAGSAAAATPPPPSATLELNAETQAGDTAVADDEEKEIRRLQAMIQNSPDLINAAVAPPFSKIPIISAVERGQLKVVKFLLDHGARVDVRPAGLPGLGRTPLLVAASTGQKAIAELLLANGADIKARDKMGLGALHLAADKGFLTVAELLIARGAEVNAVDNDGDTPLHSAARSGQPEMESLLIKYGAEVNARDNRGRTALSLAAEGKHLEAVKILLAEKADPNTVDQNGRTPLGYAGVNLELLRVLLTAKADPNLDTTEPPLIQAAGGDNSAALALLLAQGASPEVRGGDDSVTPLLVTILQSNTNGIAALLAAGADVNVQDRFGGSALHYAVRMGNPTVLQMLLEKGANPNVRNDQGLTPLDLTKPSGVASLSPSVPADVKAKLAELLRAHGALDELPDFTAIRITRGTLSPYAIFKKDSNGWNHFTLFEALLAFYNKSEFPAGIASPQTMPFPDLTQIRIQRFSPTQPVERKEIVVNLLNATNGIDCAQNLPLEFGDLIEIPEREHRLSEMPVGLTDQQRAELVRCIPKRVRVIFRSEAVELSLDPDWAYLDAAIRSSPAQSVLRSSADLTRVKVTRKDPAAGQPQEFIVNVNPSPPSSLPLPAPSPVGVAAYGRARPVEGFWLQNGDVIEVPEKPE